MAKLKPQIRGDAVSSELKKLGKAVTSIPHRKESRAEVIESDDNGKPPALLVQFRRQILWGTAIFVLSGLVVLAILTLLRRRQSLDTV